MIKVPADAGEISPEWITEALKTNGLIRSRVTQVETQTVGQGVGLMAELTRLSVSYADEEDIPSSMIAKCAARNENRGIAQLLDFYNRETNFYNKIGGAHCPFRVPTSYFGQVEDSTYDMILLLEDLGDVSPVDQLVGSTEAEAFDKIDRIAKLHAMYWNRTGDPGNAWMYDFMSVEEGVKLRDLVYGPGLEPAIEKFSSHFNSETKQVCREVGKRYVDLMGLVSPSYTFLHGDYRQDNFIYHNESGEVVIMDWQISGAGHGIFDVTYFICQSLQPELRRQIEKPLIERYVALLKQYGVDDYEFDTAWRDYRLLILFCLIYPITVCGSLDTANERGRMLGATMLDRNLTAVEELGCAEFLK
ncbi:MAG: phosphotransferase [Pseudomonadales bacterium]